jgi:hypothetical protein
VLCYGIWIPLYVPVCCPYWQQVLKYKRKFVLQTKEEFEEKEMQNSSAFNFTFDSVWLLNLVSDIKGEAYMQTEGVLEQGAEENIWTEEGCSNGRVEKTA